MNPAPLVSNIASLSRNSFPSPLNIKSRQPSRTQCILAANTADAIPQFPHLTTAVPSRRRCLLLAGVALFSGLSLAAQEEIPHINAGVEHREVGSRLIFVQGDVYDAGSGWLVPLRFSTNGNYAGWFNNEIVFGALPATPGFGGPYPNAALPGAKLYIEVTQVIGPPGGEFTFWQTRSNTPSFRVPTGTLAGTNLWKLTDGSGRPGADPYGHRHGRRFAVNLPGDYTVGFTLLDLGTNGPGAGPIHTPSELYVMRFLAQPEPFIPPPALGRPTNSNGLIQFRLVSEPNEPHVLQQSGDLSEWTDVHQFVTTNSVQLLSVPIQIDTERRFFRALRRQQP